MNIFNQPFPCNTSFKNRFFTGLGFGVFVSAFLMIFKPFELDTVSSEQLITFGAAYGGITFACIFGIASLVRIIVPGFVRDESWSTGKEILYITGMVMIVGLANFLVAPFLHNSSLNWRNMLWSEGRTFSVAILPITIYVLLKQNLLLNKFRKQAEILEKKLQEKQQGGGSVPAPPPPPANKPTDIADNNDTVTLTGDYQKEKVSVSVHQLYFISSANNYVKVFIGQNEKVSYSIIRMTMKKAEESLESYSCFFRCHRAYIINLDKVTHVEGNAQGYRVQITGVQELIPVSRNLNSEFSDRLLASRSIIA